MSSNERLSVDEHMRAWEAGYDAQRVGDYGFLLIQEALERAENDLMAVGHGPDGEARTAAMTDLRDWIAKLTGYLNRVADVATVKHEGT